jgi:hypothetical protein
LESIIIIATAIVVIAANLLISTADASAVQSDVKLSVKDGRPVAAAVQELISRYGYVITYEDPRYVFSGDLQDVTTQVRRDLDQFPPGQAPKVIVPADASLTIHVPSSSTISSKDMAIVLEQLMKAQSISGRGGHFRVERHGEIFHVLPTEVRDRKGIWAPQASIFDVPISLPMKGRNKDDMLETICEAVSAAAHVKVGFGGPVGGISSPSHPQPYRLGAYNERARNVLMRAFGLLNDPKAGTWFPQQLTWLLFYDFSDKAYSLNIQSVPDRSPAHVAPEVPRPSAGSFRAGTEVSSKK